MAELEGRRRLLSVDGFAASLSSQHRAGVVPFCGTACARWDLLIPLQHSSLRRTSRLLRGNASLWPPRASLSRCRRDSGSGR
eukprot:scaffold1916_cov294-Prasinococcus_capsulatus_cf.AAC.5